MKRMMFFIREYKKFKQESLTWKLKQKKCVIGRQGNANKSYRVQCIYYMRGTQDGHWKVGLRS